VASSERASWRVVFLQERVRELVGVETPNDLAGSVHSENLSLR